MRGGDGAGGPTELEGVSHSRLLMTPMDVRPDAFVEIVEDGAIGIHKDDNTSRERDVAREEVCGC